MNALVHLPSSRTPIKISAKSFWLLKTEGAFADYAKSELLDGELCGVPRPSAGEPETDATFPIKLRTCYYERLAELDAFSKFNKTELIDGLVYEVSPQHRPHGFAKDELAFRLRRRLEILDTALHVATEQSVVLAPYSEPQPDIILTTEPRGEGGIPGNSISLVVAVAVSTLAFDLTEKARIYAVAGIPEYWVLDLPASKVHQMWTPRADGYSERREVALGTVVEAMTITGLVVEIPCD